MTRGSIVLRRLPRPSMPEGMPLPETMDLLEVQFVDAEGQRRMIAFQPFHAPTLLVATRFDIRIDQNATYAVESRTVTPLLFCWGRNAELHWEGLIIGDATIKESTTLTGTNILEEHLPAVRAWMQTVLPRVLLGAEHGIQ